MADKKLIRLTTTDRNCIFSNEFHDEIIIKEKSEIAFHSLSMIKETTKLVITAHNDTGQFQVQDAVGNVGGLHNYFLPHGTYADTNFEVFVKEMQDEMNRALVIQAGIEFNSQVEVGVNNEHKFIISFAREPLQDMLAFLSREVGCTVDQPNETITKAVDAPSIIGDFATAHLNWIVPFTNGCGSLRARVHTHNNHAQVGKDNGFFLGLVVNPSKLQDGAFSTADIVYGFKVPTVNTGTYSKIINGVETDTGVQMLKFNFATALNTHDFLDISISGGNIIGTIYLDGSQTECFKVAYDYVNNPIYYGFIVPMAGTSNITADQVRCTLNTKDITHETKPRLTSRVGERAKNVSISLLGATTTDIPQPTDGPSNYNVIFPTLDIAQYLGFTLQNNPILQASPAGFGNGALEYIGVNGFQPVQDSDIYLVELLNMQLNSFDGYLEGRKNILAVVPVNERNVGQKDSVLQYEANNLNYITLKNDFEFSLRNIRARIVNSRFEPINTEGLTSLSFFIRQYKE